MVSLIQRLGHKAASVYRTSAFRCCFVATLFAVLVVTYLADVWSVDFLVTGGRTLAGVGTGAGAARVPLLKDRNGFISGGEVRGQGGVRGQDPPLNHSLSGIGDADTGSDALSFSGTQVMNRQEDQTLDQEDLESETSVISHHPLTANDIPSSRVEIASCEKLFAGDDRELRHAEAYQKSFPKHKVHDSAYIRIFSDCDQFLGTRKYFLTAPSEEEAEFPIAFSLLVFKDVEQVERLLRAVYRPQNYYCVHIDAKAPPVFRRAVEGLAACFDNVFITSRSVKVEWGAFSVLEPELICMEELWQYKKWKYFINLTGQEFPLKTNLELVKILKAYNGANNLEGTVQRRNRERTEYIHNGFYATQKRKTPCPVNVTLTKGSVHVAVQRGFVNYVLHNEVALKFRDWVRDTGVPDETFFSSLNYSPQLGIPGAYTGEPETNKVDNPFLTRFKNWGDGPFNWPCKGHRVRMICVFGVGDLPLLKSRPELFANKFYLEESPLALDCMEELHYNKTREEVLGLRNFSVSYYEKLSFVENHV